MQGRVRQSAYKGKSKEREGVGIEKERWEEIGKGRAKEKEQINANEDSKGEKDLERGRDGIREEIGR